MTEHNFDTKESDVESLPDLEERMRRYSRIIYNLSQPGEYKKHKATVNHYKRELIATVYEHNRLGGPKSLGPKIDRLFESLDRLHELEEKKTNKS
jgi:hypothetical protein